MASSRAQVILQLSLIKIIEFYRNLQITFSEEAEHGPNLMTRAEKNAGQDIDD